MNKKMEEVKEGNVRVVSEDFLQDVAASARSLQELLSAHILSPWGAEVKTEPVEVVAPKAKSAVVSKKSKGPIKEEGEAPSCPSRGAESQGRQWPHSAVGRGWPRWPGPPLWRRSLVTLKWPVERCPGQFCLSRFPWAQNDSALGWQEAAHRCHVGM